MFLRSFLPSLFLSSLILRTSVTSLPTKRSTSASLINDFPDPTLLRVGSTWYAFATENEAGTIHVQVASPEDFNNWSRAEGKDALPTLPDWVDAAEPSVWAPHVIQRVSTHHVSDMKCFGLSVTGG